MFHHVARALPGLRLFHDAHEAAHLWSCLTRRLAPIEALVLMPDHLHLIAVVDLSPQLAQVLSGHARWLNARRGTRGAWVRPLPSAEALVDDQKVRRSIRYVHLNPCRARLAEDPLAWPWSTYRDLVKAHPKPASLHAYTSGDPSVHVAGTELPTRCHATPWR